MKDSLKLEVSDEQLIKRKKALLSSPVQDIDLEKSATIGQLVDAFEQGSIQARNLGVCSDIFVRMLQDEERPIILLGLAGPLISAGLRKVIRDLIAFGMVDIVVSTGAIMYQDYYRANGYHHFKGTPNADDAVLRDLLIDRIYDSYVDEEKFIELDEKIGRFADTLSMSEYSSRSFLEQLADTISDEQSILFTARKHGVPIFCPAMNDSSIGIGLTEHYRRKRVEGKQPVTISAIRDNYEITQIIVQSKRTAAVYVAGGVPKNYINDSIVMAYIFGRDTGGHKYAIQMTTDAPHWGGLSGSTLSEATSWGKINRSANCETVFVEPSVSFPLIVGNAIEKKAFASRSRVQFVWDRDLLKEIKFMERQRCI